MMVWFLHFEFLSKMRFYGPNQPLQGKDPLHKHLSALDLKAPKSSWYYIQVLSDQLVHSIPSNISEED